MATLPEPIVSLVAALGKLPGIGPRSAERIALFLVQADRAVGQNVAAAIVRAGEKISLCQVCGGLTEAQPCGICAAPNRDAASICVVERAVDLLSIEKSGVFRGLYHVLGGKLSPLNGVEPEDLRIRELARRLEGGAVKEVILALPSDVEGDATSYYLKQLLAPQGVRLSRLAQGLPAGSGLELADDLTLARALEGRREFN